MAFPERFRDNQVQGLPQGRVSRMAENFFRPPVPEADETLAICKNNGIFGFRHDLLAKPVG
jgi:hypothetical protein